MSEGPGGAERRRWRLETSAQLAQTPAVTPRPLLAIVAVACGCGGEREPAPSPRGEPAPLVALAPGDRVLSLVADGDELAWVRLDARGAATVERRRAGTVERVAELAPLAPDVAASVPSLVALRAGRVAWIDPGRRRAHVDAEVSLADEPVGIALDPSGRGFVVTRGAIERVDGASAVRVAALEQAATPCRVAVDDTHVWLAERAAWRVARAPVAGGAVEVYADRRRLACGVHAGAARATWVEVDPTLRVFVTRFAKTELPPPDFIPAASTEVGLYTPSGYRVDLAVVDDAAFTLNEEDGKLVEVDLARTEARTRRDGLSRPTSVAATATTVVWADATGVWRLSR